MPITINGHAYYRTAEACQMVGITKNTFLRWVREESFPDVEHRDKRGWRLFTEDEIDRLRQEVNPINTALSSRRSSPVSLGPSPRRQLLRSSMHQHDIREYTDPRRKIHTSQEERAIRDSVVFRQLIADLDVSKEQYNQVEQALLESDQKIRNIFSSSPDAITVTDLMGNITECNEETLKLHGFSSKEELIGKSAFTLIAEKDHARAMENLNKVLKQATLKNVEYTFVTKQGKEFPAELSASVIEDSFGRPIAFVAITKDITEHKRAQEELQQSYERLQSFIRGIIQVMASIIEIRDPYTAGHQLRVAKLACAIGKEMGLLSKEQIDGIHAAGLVHDIGKIYVPAELLSKPSLLSNIEVDLIKTHPKIGYDILKQIEFPWPVAQIVLQHHERMNGTGYPLGLSGKNILTEARILAVADVVEAMSSHRPYRPAHSMDEALSEILQNKGILYDPKVVDACWRLFTEKGVRFEAEREFRLQQELKQF